MQLSRAKLLPSFDPGRNVAELVVGRWQDAIAGIAVDPGTSCGHHLIDWLLIDSRTLYIRDARVKYGMSLREAASSFVEEVNSPARRLLAEWSVGVRSVWQAEPASAELERHGWHVFPINCNWSSRVEALNEALRDHYGGLELVLHPRLDSVAHVLEVARWAEEVRARKKTQDPSHSHWIDCLGYALLGCRMASVPLDIPEIPF